MATQYSFGNHAQGATVGTSGAAITFQTGWPLTNIRYPQQPYVFAKTTGLLTTPATVVDLTIDWSPATTIAAVAVFNVNFTSLALWGQAPDNSIVFYTPVTVSRNPWTSRYNYVLALASAVTLKNMRVRIFQETPITDGQAYYSIGGVWAGAILNPPRDYRWEERPRIVEPHIDVPLLGGGTSRVSTGPPTVELRARRVALVNSAHPATADELGSWLDLDAAMRAFGHFLVYFNRGNASHGFIMRRMNESEWPIHPKVSEDDLILHEVVGP